MIAHQEYVGVDQWTEHRRSLPGACRDIEILQHIVHMVLCKRVQLLDAVQEQFIPQIDLANGYTLGRCHTL